jgi:hypothetical protein
MTRGRHRGTTRRPPRAKPGTPAERPLDEAKAILHDVEGTLALDELRVLKSIGNKPGKVTVRAASKPGELRTQLLSARLPVRRLAVTRHPNPRGFFTCRTFNSATEPARSCRRRTTWDG